MTDEEDFQDVMILGLYAKRLGYLSFDETEKIKEDGVRKIREAVQEGRL